MRTIMNYLLPITYLSLFMISCSNGYFGMTPAQGADGEEGCQRNAKEIPGVYAALVDNNDFHAIKALLDEHPRGNNKNI